jgi:hypothetical protein
MDSDLKHKLSNYSETPPPSAWEGIDKALDEQPAFADKLFRYEQTPPATAWEKVAQQLTPAPVVLFRTNLFKYAIAAAVLLAIAMGSLLFIKHSSGPNLASQPQQYRSSDSLSNTSSDSQLRTGASATAWQHATTAGETSRDVFANNSAAAAIVHFSPQVVLSKTLPDPVREITVVPEEKNNINTELLNRYMIATTATGDAVRLPKKAYSDYACADVYANLQCKQKIQSIQSQMAASVTTEFTDFIDLLNKLQDN